MQVPTLVQPGAAAGSAASAPAVPSADAPAGPFAALLAAYVHTQGLPGHAPQAPADGAEPGAVPAETPAETPAEAPAEAPVEPPTGASTDASVAAPPETGPEVGIASEVADGRPAGLRGDGEADPRDAEPAPAIAGRAAPGREGSTPAPVAPGAGERTVVVPRATASAAVAAAATAPTAAAVTATAAGTAAAPVAGSAPAPVSAPVTTELSVGLSVERPVGLSVESGGGALPVAPATSVATAAGPPAADPVAPAVAGVLPPASAAQPIVLPAVLPAVPPDAVPSGSAASQVAAVVEAQAARVGRLPDGTHRLSVSLYPAALGEVQVTLTLRRGELTVRLAGSREARAALAADGAMLHRVLGQVAGASAAVQVTLHDLGPVATAPLASGGSAAADTGSPPPAAGGQHGSGHQPPTDHHRAGTHGGAPQPAGRATDGDVRETGPAGAPSNRSATSAPTGLDVTV